MNNIYIIGGAVALAGSVYYLNRKKNIEAITGGGSGTGTDTGTGGTGGGSGTGGTDTGTGGTGTDTGTISNGGGTYIDPAWTTPDNTVDEDITIPETSADGSGSVTITEDEVLILGGGFGEPQHFYSGTIWYDFHVTRFRAEQAGALPYANIDYVKSAVFNFYNSVENYGTDNAVTNMTAANKQYWPIISAYCPFTYLPTAEGKYKIKVSTGTTNQDIDAAYAAMFSASQALMQYKKSAEWKALNAAFAAGTISLEEFKTKREIYQALYNDMDSKYKYYRSLGGTLTFLY